MKKMKRFIVFFVFILLINVGVFLYTAQSDAQGTPAIPTIDSLVARSACQVDMKFSETGSASYFSASVRTSEGTPNGGQDIPGLSTPPSPLNYSFKYPDYQFAKNRTYYFALQAHSDIGGTSAWSAQKNVKTLDVVAPPAPAVVGHGAWEQETRTKISWSIPSGMTPDYSGYRVYSSENGKKYIADAITSSPEYYAIVDPTKPFYFKIKAYEAGLGCPLDTISTSTDGGASFSEFSGELLIPPVPVITKEEVTPSGSDWKIKLLWNKSAGATDYDVDFANDSEFSDIITALSVSDTSFNLNKTFASNKTVFYRVRAKAGPGISNYKKGSIVTGVPAPASLSVSGISFNQCSNETGAKIGTFTWTDNASNNQRKIKFEQSEDGKPFAEIASYNVPNIEPDGGYSKAISFPIGHTYDVRIYVDANGKKSNYSNVVTVNLVPYTPLYKLTGEAWTQTGGWLKLDPGSGFCGVSVDKDGKTLRGEAWNPLFGWLSFDEKTTGRAATIDVSTGEISGWARFMFKNSVGNGWDGWVNLRDTSSPIKYGLCLGDVKRESVTALDEEGVEHVYGTGEECEGNGGPTNNKVTGMMWGGPVIGGWIPFVGKSAQSMTIKKFPDINLLAPRERVKLWVTPLPQQDTAWSLAPVGEGTLNPLTTNGVNTSTIYSAPIVGEKAVKVTAISGTESTNTTLQVVKDPYSLSCLSQKNSIRVNWAEQWVDPDYVTYAPHKLTLAYSTSSVGGPWKTLSPNPNPLSPESGVYDHRVLSTTTSYAYKLEAVFSGPNPSTSTIVVDGCTVGVPVVDNPSRLRVFAQDAKTLVLNWKDNATSSANYKFEVQRIKLTPAPSTDFAVTSTVRSTGISLSWKNFTTSTPFYMWIERSSSTVNRFANPNKKDPTYPACSIAEGGDSACVINKKFGVFRPIVNTAVTPKTFIGQLTPFVATDDVTRDGEGTTFFYRIRACSSISPKYIECGGSLCLLNTDYRPNPACTPFTDTSANGILIATTTPPLPIIKAVSTKPEKVTPADKDSLYKIALSWTDDSLRESGMIVQRGPDTAVLVGGKIQFKNRDIKKLPLDTDVVVFGPYSGRGTLANLALIDETLEPGTKYEYRVKPFYDFTDPLTGNKARVFTPDVEISPIIIETPQKFARSEGVLASIRLKISKLLVNSKIDRNSSPVSSFTASVYSTISSIALEIKNMVTGLFSASAATNSDEDYFVKASADISQSSFTDENLDANSVYLYRVGIKYPSDTKTNKWALPEGSGKTLPKEITDSREHAPVCVRNSYCDFSLKKWEGPSVNGLNKKESSEQQCQTNSDCVNVGRKRQTTEEQ